MKKTEVTKARIKQLIEEKCGGNQQRFADKCDISKHSVSQYVNGVSVPGAVNTGHKKKTPEGAYPSGVSFISRRSSF